MTKKELTTILARASSSEVQEIAKKIQEKYEVKVLKEPQKTLVMVKVRESIKRSLFYLGEVLASECMIRINDQKGTSVIAGDDFDKTFAAAVIDGAINAGLEEEFDIYNTVEALGREQEKQRAYRNTEILKSKVNFNVMGE